MILLIDGDILVYRTGFSCPEGTPEWIARARLDKTVEALRLTTNCKDTEVFLSDSLENNYRTSIFPLYKANRKTMRKPPLYEFLSNTLAEDYPTSVSSGQEADDDIGIRAMSLGKDCIIASIDKDLLQIPGTHYNWVKDRFTSMSPAGGLHKFYMQILTGDATDNITPAVGLSCPGVGEKKASRYLEGCSSQESYNDQIWRVYKRHTLDHDETELRQRILVKGQIVKIRQYPGELWQYDYKEEV